MIDIKADILQWFINSFDNKSLGGVVTRDKSAIMSNQQLAEKLRKPIIRNLEKYKLYSSCKDNINFGAFWADMQLTSKYNKEFWFLLYFIDIFSKCTWLVLLKDKKGIKNTNAFQKVLNDPRPKPNQIWYRILI